MLDHEPHKIPARLELSASETVPILIVRKGGKHSSFSSSITFCNQGVWQDNFPEILILIHCAPQILMLTIHLQEARLNAITSSNYVIVTEHISFEAWWRRTGQIYSLKSR